MICAIFDSIEALQILCQYGGVDPGAKDNNDKTAIKLAEQYGTLKCIDYMRIFSESLMPVRF